MKNARHNLRRLLPRPVPGPDAETRRRHLAGDVTRANAKHYDYVRIMAQYDNYVVLEADWNM